MLGPTRGVFQTPTSRLLSSSAYCWLTKQAQSSNLAKLGTELEELHCCTAWPILTHLDPSWPILTHLDPSWPILTHLDPCFRFASTTPVASASGPIANSCTWAPVPGSSGSLVPHFGCIDSVRHKRRDWKHIDTDTIFIESRIIKVFLKLDLKLFWVWRR